MALGKIFTQNEEVNLVMGALKVEINPALDTRPPDCFQHCVRFVYESNKAWKIGPKIRRPCLVRLYISKSFCLCVSRWLCGGRRGAEGTEAWPPRTLLLA
jgi:hypothetical protein